MTHALSISNPMPATSTRHVAKSMMTRTTYRVRFVAVETSALKKIRGSEDVPMGLPEFF